MLHEERELLQAAVIRVPVFCGLGQVVSRRGTLSPVLCATQAEDGSLHAAQQLLLMTRSTLAAAHLLSCCQLHRILQFTHDSVSGAVATIVLRDTYGLMSYGLPNAARDGQ